MITALAYGNNLLRMGNMTFGMLTPPEPPTPTLPPYTIRMKFIDGVTPTFSKGTATQVTSSPNVWDLTYENNNWSLLIKSQTNLLEVIGANTVGVTNMSNMFYKCASITTVPLFNTSKATDMNNMFNGCTSLTSVPLFDTSNVTNMSSMFYKCASITTVPLFNTSKATRMLSMFYNCSSLTSVPLFDTSKVKSMSQMLQNCYNVQSGALALYQQASTQATPPSQYTDAFKYCGRDTVTGAAELAQIPASWGGTAS